MKTSTVVAAAFALAGLACAEPMAEAQARAEGGSLGTLGYGTPSGYRNLTLVPITSTEARQNCPYITLAEALASGAVAIREAEGGGEVNTLLLSNRGGKPVFLLAGEVVLGGKQDRCVARDTLLPAGAKDYAVPVYCVEQGRWRGKSAFDAVAKAVASPTVRRVAQAGALGKSVVPQHLRIPATAESARQQEQIGADNRVGGDSAQSMVWSEVAAETQAFRAGSGTGTYRGVVNAEAGLAAGSLQPYVQALSARILKTPHIVGVVAAVNGQPIAADIFGNAGLFRKLWPRLLASYAAVAARSTPGSSAAKPFTASSARAFVASVERSTGRGEHQDVGLVTTHLENSKITAFIASPARVPLAAGRPGALHINILAK